ncbi:MAG: FtsX-like permease family protein [Steroidobacteraceae bacterium]|jgi:putative ABC transport system permease protein
MELRPILSAMRRNKVGAILIAVQMAITLGVLCNGLFIIEQRVASSRRPTGTDEANIFVIRNLWVGNPADIKGRLSADLDALRSVPGVVDAFVSNSYPLSNGGSTDSVRRNPDQKDAITLTALYFADEHALQALGVKLIAGRNFTANEIVDKMGFGDWKQPSVVIITRALAERLFPGGDALGQTVYLEAQKHQTTIIGIVDTLQVPWVEAGGWGSKFNNNSMLEPFRYVDPYSDYVVRTRPGQLASAMQAAQRKLIEIDRARVIEKVQPLTAAREEAYRNDRGLVVILGVVCAALLLVTAFGIVGLTSYWVAQRRRQIGIRRALGATRQAIVRYFQTENFLIAAAGVVLGVALAISANLWMVSSFEMERLHVSYAFIGAAAVLLLGQAAALWPALRAASVPPALATRGV